jgi:hypothetical protein
MNNNIEKQAKAWWGGKSHRLQNELLDSYPINIRELKGVDLDFPTMDTIVMLYQWYLGKEKSEIDCILLSLDKPVLEPTMESFTIEIISDMNDADTAYYEGKELHCHQALERAKRKIEAAIEWNKRFGL